MFDHPAVIADKILTEFEGKQTSKLELLRAWRCGEYPGMTSKLILEILDHIDAACDANGWRIAG
jgi:hypothetical protein